MIFRWKFLNPDNTEMHCSYNFVSHSCPLGIKVLEFSLTGVSRCVIELQAVLWGVLRLWVFALCAAGVPAAVSASDLQFALQSLEETGQVSVTREGTCAGYSWTIKWKSPGGKQPLLQVPSLGQLLVPQQRFLLHCFLNSAFCYFASSTAIFATLFP